MRVTLIAAEVSPWAKVGGLADVIGALPAALMAEGARCAAVLPAYRVLLKSLPVETVASGLTVRLGSEEVPFSLLRAQNQQKVPFYLVDYPRFFDRAGVYGEPGKSYTDNFERYVFFGRAAAKVAADFLEPDVVHAHDWHAAMAPIAMRADAELAKSFERTAVAFTIHNLAFQGIGEASDFPLLGLEPGYFSVDFLEFYGRINLMKGAVVMADGASTVSPSYAREISTDPDLGFGLDGVLRAKGEGFVGILNGADYNEWDPAHDSFIPARYTATQLSGKATCKRRLLERMGLAGAEKLPVVGMVTRLSPQKGTDLLQEVLEDLMKAGLALAILGSGDPEAEQFLRSASERHPNRLGVVIGFDNALAHQIQAGSDLFLMPSRFEPCGLTQMYALKYGTIPVVRATGGLRDTVSEFDPRTGAGTGFVFERYAANEMAAALGRAVALYRQPVLWQRLVQNAFASDFSWRRAAREYLRWFEQLSRSHQQRPAALAGAQA